MNAKRAAASRPEPVTLGLQPSFGFGDRLGLATPGHIEAMRRAGHGIAPIFPQQSIREQTNAQTGWRPRPGKNVRGALIEQHHGFLGAVVTNRTSWTTDPTRIFRVIRLRWTSTVLVLIPS